MLNLEILKLATSSSNTKCSSGGPLASFSTPEVVDEAKTTSLPSFQSLFLQYCPQGPVEPPFNSPRLILPPPQHHLAEPSRSILLPPQYYPPEHQPTPYTQSSAEPPRSISPAPQYYPPEHQPTLYTQSSAEPKKEPKYHTWTLKDSKKLVWLRNHNTPWKEIAYEFHGISENACRKHYSYLISNWDWSEEENRNLTLVYNASRQEIWQIPALSLGIPWEVVEANLWKQVEQDIKSRAVPTFDTPANENNTLPPIHVQNPVELPVRLRRPVQRHHLCAPDFKPKIHARRYIWSSEDSRKLVSYKKAGLSWKEIAKKFPGATDSNCSTHYHYLNSKRSGRRRNYR